MAQLYAHLESYQEDTAGLAEGCSVKGKDLKKNKTKQIFCTKIKPFGG